MYGLHVHVVRDGASSRQSHGVRDYRVRGVPHVGHGLFGAPRPEIRITNVRHLVTPAGSHEDGFFYESGLQKADGSPNKGKFGT